MLANIFTHLPQNLFMNILYALYAYETSSKMYIEITKHSLQTCI